jgi:hypothetical protein
MHESHECANAIQIKRYRGLISCFACRKARKAKEWRFGDFVATLQRYPITHRFATHNRDA